jgi:DNA-binding response OmpR family regulator
MNRILLVEDDLSLIEGLEFSLKKDGYQVDLARTVREALERFRSQSYDLLILDLGLPDGSGFEICRKVRQTSATPVIFLTASDEEVNVVMGLDLGGDDYITKPFRLNELMSRIRALLRRANLLETQPKELESNGIVVRLLESRVLKDGQEIILTPAEYRLLCLLMEHPNQVLPRSVILDRLWDTDGNFIDDNTLSVYVRRLRGKIEDDPENAAFLLTVRGVGYQWSLVR